MTTRRDADLSLDRSDDEPTRKPYSTPVLQVYGDLAEITRNQNNSGSDDGAGHPNKHFTM